MIQYPAISTPAHWMLFYITDGVPRRFNPDTTYVILCITNMYYPAPSPVAQCKLLYVSDRLSHPFGPSNMYAFNDCDILSHPFDPGTTYIIILSWKKRPPLQTSHAVDDEVIWTHPNAFSISLNTLSLSLTLWSLLAWEIWFLYSSYSWPLFTPSFAKLTRPPPHA